MPNGSWVVRELAARLLWPQGEIAQDELERSLAMDEDYGDEYLAGREDDR